MTVLPKRFQEALEAPVPVFCGVWKSIDGGNDREHTALCDVSLERDVEALLVNLDSGAIKMPTAFDLPALPLEEKLYSSI